jgi:isopentenyl-diphosphate delta-isomerase
VRQVVTVNEAGHPTGLMEIVAAHTNGGTLHLAFSVYVFRNSRAELLMQRRSPTKMLWPLAWANTCCSHPLPGEALLDAAHRRLQEECGFSTLLRVHSALVYRADDPRGVGTEHEYLTLFTGEYHGSMVPDPDEIAEWKWVRVVDVQRDMARNPAAYAPWFHLGLARVVD